MTTTTTEDQTVLEVDDRRRVPLGRIGNKEHRRYLVREEPGGVIILTPAVVLTETELALLRDPQLTELLVRTATDPSSRVKRGRPTPKD